MKFEDYIIKLQPAVEDGNKKVDYYKKLILADKPIEPILVDKSNIYYVVDGNHKLKAYQELNETPIIWAVNRKEFLRNVYRFPNITDWLDVQVLSKDAILVNEEYLNTYKG